LGDLGINSDRRHRPHEPATGLRRLGRILLGVIAGALPLVALAVASARACTIVVLTDGRDVLFCNNEDWSNPNTRIWFVPGDDGRHGCAYLGFDDGWGQGGLNTKGLAYDWVAGFQEKWGPDPKRRPVRGGPCHRMLETCATVEEAVAFFDTYEEPSFAYGKLLVADRSGASAIIGAKDGRLHVETRRGSHVLTLGWRLDEVGRMLSDDPSPSPANSVRVLRASLQEGKYATKYSNVFDLKSGEISVYCLPGREEALKLDLYEELKKGGHYYDIPEVARQRTQELKPLTHDMRNR
jgi:hypothetical protein